MRKTFTKTACLIVFLLSIQFSLAQIVYTDIEDVYLQCRKSCYLEYYLDLNNDGNNDFTITTSTTNNVTYKCFRTPCKYHENFIAATGFYHLNGNAVAGTVIIPQVTTIADAFAINAGIGSSLNWGFGGYLKYSTKAGCSENYQCQTFSYGYWPIDTDYYLGLKLIVNNQSYYGWVRISIFLDDVRASFKVKDYAYESTPETSILAGDKGNSITAKSPGKLTEEQVAESNELRVYPNPVSSTTAISFSLSKPEKVSITVYDVTGRIVKTIADKEINEGEHQVTLDVKDMNAGIYLLRLQTAEFVRSKKIVVVK